MTPEPPSSWARARAAADLFVDIVLAVALATLCFDLGFMLSHVCR